MDTTEASGEHSGTTLTVDGISWSMQAHDVGGKVQDGSEKSYNADDLLDNISETTQEHYKDSLPVSSKVHSASHASTMSLKSFDIHEEGHHKLNNRVDTRTTKSAGCCCIL